MKKFLRNFLKILIALFILLNVVVAFQAYKFTHFYDAGDVTFKPTNQKNFWDHTKEALFGINAIKIKDTASVNYGFDTIYLTTKGGLKLEGWYKSVAYSKGTIALFHGHGGNKSDILPEAFEFVKMGYNIFLLDFRAHGNSEGHTCTIGFNEAEDVKLTYDYIRDKGEKNLVLWGVSLGAATITKAISEYNIQPQKIILELPFASIEQAVKGRLRMMHVPTEPVSELLTFWGGAENGFWAFDHKPSIYVKKITCPVLLQFAKNDVRVSAKEREDIYNHITSPKQLVLYENSAHESLCKKENAKWAATVSGFLNQ